MRTLRSLPLLFWLGIAGCGGAAESNLLEPGPGTKDSGSSSDSGIPDVQMNDVMPMHDTGPVDATPPMDTTPPPVDTGPPDTGPARPPLTCGGSSCTDPGNVCCAHTNSYPKTYTCEPAADYKTCSSGGGAPIFCGSPGDCPGKICCGQKTSEYGDTYSFVSCATTCDSTNGTRITFCDPTGPSVCTYPATCNMSTILDGYYICN